VTSSLRHAEASGNVLLPARSSGLPADSVANVSQVITLDRRFLTALVGSLPRTLVREIDAGLRIALDL
jgi:mRNA interferase MazF